MRAAGRRPAPETLEPAEEDEILQARDAQVERAIARRHRPDTGTERPPALRAGRSRPRGRGRRRPRRARSGHGGVCLAGAVRPQERMDLAAADDEETPSSATTRPKLRETSRTSTSSGAAGAGWSPAVAGTCSLEWCGRAALPFRRLGLVQAAYTVVNSAVEVAPRRPRRDRSLHRVDGTRRNASRASKRRIGAMRSGKKPDSPTCAGVDILERELRAPTQLDRLRREATPAGPTSAGDQRGPGSWRGSRRGSGRLRRTRPRRPPGRTTSQWRTRQARIRVSRARPARRPARRTGSLRDGQSRASSIGRAGAGAAAPRSR